MRLLFFLLLPTIANALTYNERFDVQIIKVYDKNVLVLNRGLEDGIVKNDHIKLTTPDGFIARGVCIKEGMMSSHWKIYRVVRPELVSKDTIYHLNSMNQSEIPEDIQELYTNVDFSREYKDWDEKDLNEQLRLQQKRFAEYDFPKSTEGVDLYPENHMSKAEYLLHRHFNRKKFMKDLKTLNFNVFASPYSTNTLENQKSANYGFNAKNEGEKYDITANYLDEYQKIADPVNRKSIIRARNILNAEVEIKDFDFDWGYLTYVQYDNARYGNIYTPRTHVKFAPFGMRYEITPMKGISYSDLSYFVFYDYRVDDKLTIKEKFDPAKGGNVFDGYDVDETRSTRIRHGIRWRWQGKFNDYIVYSNELWYQPSMSISNWNFDFQDVDMTNTFRFSFLLNDNLYLDLENIYRYDVLMKDYYGVDPSYMANVIHFRYSFNI